MKHLSSTVKPTAATVLLLTSTLHCCWLRTFNQQTNGSQMHRIDILSAIFSEFSLKSFNCSTNFQENKGDIFVNTFKILN